MRVMNAKNLPRELQQNPPENEIWVTQALKNLINNNSNLQRRFAKFQIREKFPQEFASSPDSLALIFRIPDAALENPYAHLRSFSTEQISKIYEDQKIQNNEQFAFVRSTAAFVAVLLVTPIIILVAEAAKIGIIQREKRFATLSIAGATLPQIRSLIVLESLPNTILGLSIGFMIFTWLIVAFLSHTPVIGATFWTSDLQLSATILALVAFVIIIATVFTNFQALRKIKISPLFVSRASGVQKRPSPLTILPLFLSVTSLALFAEYGKDWYHQNTDFGSLILAGFTLIIIIGIFLGGPFMIYILAKIFSKIRYASGEIASFRLRNNALNVFRSISGIVIALFIGSIFATFFATSQAEEAAHTPHSYDSLSTLERPLQVTVSTPYSTQFDKLLLAKLSGSRELQKITGTSYTQRSFIADDFSSNLSGQYYESCEELASKTRLTCPERITEPIIISTQISTDSSKKVQPKIESVHGVTGKIYDSEFIFVAKTETDLTNAKNEIQTVVYNFQRQTGNFADIKTSSNVVNSLFEQIKSTSTVISTILATVILIGGLSIFIGTVGGIFERRRFFTQLNILGAKLSTAMLSIIIEVAIPLMTISFFAIWLGIFCCWAMFKIIIADSFNIILPDPQFWIIVSATIVLVVALMLSTLPVVNKMLKDNFRAE